jgi:ABC-type bacteriocin/lantibiotic exporter with double-glycine peptidase domain
LARAILQKSSITILDESYSHLDQETSMKIHNNLLKILENKTLIFITHNTSILKNMDQIIILENGKILNQNVK